MLARQIMTREIPALREYIRALGFARDKAPQRQPQFPFITISREAGAGGSTLAEKIVAEGARRGGTLFSGWSVCDRGLCEAVASDPELTVVLDSLLREEFRGEFSDYLTRFIVETSPQSVIMHRMFRAMRAAAAMGKTVIVGRAGCCVTRGLPMGVHLRLVAPKGQRAANLERVLGIERSRSQDECEALDASRRRLVKAYFHKDIDAPLLYDAVWNAGTVPLETIAAQALELAQSRWSAFQESSRLAHAG